MSNLFVNKVLGAFLAAGLGIIVINKFSNAVMRPDVPTPDKFAYSLTVEAPTGPVEIIPVPFPSPAWLGGRDAERGAKVFKKCKSCHTSNAGGKNGTGTALWNIVGRPMAATSGYSYSPSMASMGADGGVWGFEELDKFLTKPKDYVAKTKMAFNGIKKETDRAALIEYLRLAADMPIPQLVAVETPPTQDVVQEIIQESVEETAPTTDGEQ